MLNSGIHFNRGRFSRVAFAAAGVAIALFQADNVLACAYCADRGAWHEEETALDDIILAEIGRLRFGAPATTRNWSTVTKVVALLS